MNEFNAEESAGDDPETSALAEESSTRQGTYWEPLFVTSAIYTIIVFAISCINATSFDPWFQIASCAIVFAEVQLTAIYAALGPGTYFKRLAISLTCLLFVFLGLFGGFALSSQRPTPELPGLFLLTLLASAFASQAVFGFFRFVRGWRFHKKDVERGSDFCLQDLFTLTMFIAVCLSAINSVSPGIGANESYSLPFFGILLCVASFGTLLYGIPTLATTFSFGETEQGCLSQGVIVTLITFLFTMPFVAFSGDIVVAPTVVFLATIAAFTWLPLAHMRERDFVLTKRND